MWNRTARALSVAALSGASLVAPALGAASGDATAAAADSAGTVMVKGDTIVFRAAQGDANNLTIADDKSGHISIFENPPDLNPITSSDCTQDGPQKVDCNAAFINRIVLHLGDRNDYVFTDIPWWMPSAAYTVFGGRGNDSIGGNGGGYADTLYGQAGNDRLTGYSGNDRLFGGLGKDHLIGSSGDDVLHGGLGDDVTHGSDGSDTIFGGTGADRLHGGPGSDTLAGQQGDDQLFSKDYTLDFLYGGAGIDSAVRDPEDVVTGIETLP